MVKMGRNTMQDRIEKLKNQISCLENMGERYSLRERYIRESLGSKKCDSPTIQRAKAFKNILDNTELIILDDELIVGSILGIFPVYKHQYTEEEIYKEAKIYLCKKIKSGEKPSSSRTLMEHDYDYRGARVSYEILRKVSQNLAAELDLNYEEVFGELQEYFSENPQVYYLLQKFFHSENISGESPYTFAHHIAVNYEKVLKEGYKDILKEAEVKFKKAEGEEKEFFQAVIISLEAVIEFIKRYSKKASEMAEAENNLRRKRELEEIADRCRQISENPAGNFHEALQLVWFTHLILALGGGIALAFGRFDQYIYPYYQKDIREGKIDKEKAIELLSNFLLKCNEPKLGQVQNLTIGGILPIGEDGTNEISYLCLEALKKAKVPYPNLSVRLYKDTPEDFYIKVIETIKFGRVSPSMFNDDILIPALYKAGFDLQDARDYCVMGCQEIMIPKKQPSWEVGSFFNFPKYLELLLYKKEEFVSFDELIKEFKEELSKNIKEAVKRINKKYTELYKIGKDPFASSLLDKCMERGKDMYQGGTKYPASIGMWGLGIATLSDSLAAIRKLVYEEKRISLMEFVNILRENFKDNESFREMLFNRMPKYGNDDDYVDLIAKDIGEYFCREVLKHRGPNREFYLPLLASYMGHIQAGENLGATPDGRKAGEPISDAASPSQGRDINGPTAALNSISKIDYTLTPGGVSVNMKFSPKVLEGEKGTRNLVSLFKSYFQKGGQQIQINLVDKEMLKDAQMHPENYRNLVVRVAGFNEYFIKLDVKLQEEIIARTEQ